MGTLLFTVLFILTESSGHASVSDVNGPVRATTESNIITTGFGAYNSGFYTLSEKTEHYNPRLRFHKRLCEEAVHE
jgi:hypothetical protein